MADPTRTRNAQIEMVTRDMQRDSDRVQSSYQTANVGDDGFVDQNPFSSGPPRRKEKNFFGMNGKGMRFWICLVGLVGCLIFIIAIAAKGAKANNDDTTVSATVSTVAVTFVATENDAGVKETTVTEKSTTAPTTATANDTETTTGPISDETTLDTIAEKIDGPVEEVTTTKPSVEETTTAEITTKNS